MRTEQDVRAVFLVSSPTRVALVNLVLLVPTVRTLVLVFVRSVDVVVKPMPIKRTATSVNQVHSPRMMVNANLVPFINSPLVWERVSVIPVVLVPK